MKWNISFINNNNINLDLDLVLNKFNEYKFQNNIDKNFGIADPFIYKNYIFCELLDNNLKGTPVYMKINNKIHNEKNNIIKKIHTGGVLAYAKIESTLTFKIFMCNIKSHLSYPFIFEKNNEIYLIPESSQIKKLHLYKCIKFPDKWILLRTLLNNKNVYDSTYFRIDNIGYIFTTEYILYRISNSQITKE